MRLGVGVGAVFMIRLRKAVRYGVWDKGGMIV